MTLKQFEEACLELGIALTSQQKEQFNIYYHLLVEWNQTMNLTGITEEKQVYLKHFYDSLTLQKAISFSEMETLCDVGTGAGFPGLVLKIAFPHLQVTLVDSLGKRIHFLNHVIETLQLTKIETVQARAEEYALIHREAYDIVTARAVAKLNVLAEYCLPLVKVGGYFIPLKATVEEELEVGKKACSLLGGTLEQCISFSLPEEESSRTLLKIKKEKPTARCYPRRFSEIKKRPLGL